MLRIKKPPHECILPNKLGGVQHLKGNPAYFELTSTFAANLAPESRQVDPALKRTSALPPFRLFKKHSGWCNKEVLDVIGFQTAALAVLSVRVYSEHSIRLFESVFVPGG